MIGACGAAPQMTPRLSGKRFHANKLHTPERGRPQSLAQRTQVVRRSVGQSLIMKDGPFKNNEQLRVPTFYDAWNGTSDPPIIFEPGLQGRVLPDGFAISKIHQQKFDVKRGGLACRRGRRWSIRAVFC